MVNLAKVYIWNEYAGAVLWNENTGTATFEYEPSFAKKGWELSPLMMPINDNRSHSFRELSKETFMGLPGLLADALPDAYGKALLDRWLASLGRTFANPVERLCYQSKRSMGALEFVPAKDDQYEQAFQVMRRLRLPYGQAEQMFRRMVFNVIARNQDDHTKNISFLMDKTGTWKLSPAYDVSWAYNPKGEWTSHHQMSINNKWDDITRADLMAVAEAMHIKRAGNIIDEICNAVSMWATIAKEYDIPSEMVTEIDRTLLYRGY